MTVSRSHVALFATLALMLVAAPSQAMRHLKLVKSSPSADTTMAVSPDAIRLWLSEPAEAAASKISLATSTGTAIPLEKITRDTAKNAPLVAKLTAPIKSGQYTVTWKAMSKDGHVVNGTFGFRVATVVGAK